MVKSKLARPLEPTGILEIDLLTTLSDDECSIDVYVRAASAYVRASGDLSVGKKKASQIRLSNALARALKSDLRSRVPKMGSAVAGERKVSGALRSVNADVSEIHETDGLRLAVELKPVNLAVGRAIWNRFGDIRTFAVNLHLKFPFCVIGGVLAIPTYEAIGSVKEIEEALADPGDSGADEIPEETKAISSRGRKSTIHLIERAIARLTRAGGRKTEGDAPHLLEGVAVVVYDPDTGKLHPNLPPLNSGLRWEEFVEQLADAYESRFEL